jgi:signal transduction histidine kinase
VLINLISNALKFTQEGWVTIRVYPSESSDDSITLEIEDTGVGIKAEDQGKLFRMFGRL